MRVLFGWIGEGAGLALFFFFLPTTSHPGRRVGSRQSFSTMRAALYISRNVAMSVCAWPPGPRPGSGARRPNQLSITIERVHESLIICFTISRKVLDDFKERDKLTHGVLRRRPYSGLFGLTGSALSDEFVEFVGIPEHSLNVGALDCGIAVFHEEGVGLPVWGAGAAIYRCNVLDAGYVKR